MEDQLQINQNIQINQNLQINSNNNDNELQGGPIQQPNLMQQQEADPIAAASRAVLTDRSRSEDSFTMQTIKDGIRRLSEIRNGDADPADLLRQYDWLIYIGEEKYLATRRKDSSYSARHQKVRNLINLCKQDRTRILQNNPEAAQIGRMKAERRGNRDAERRVEAEHSTLRRHAQNLKTRLLAFQPTETQEFTAELDQLLRAYGKLIKDYESIANSICIRRSAKEARRDARRILRQLQAEREYISTQYSYDKRTAERFQRWGEPFAEPEPVKLTQEELASSQSVFQTEKKGQETTQLFVTLFGVGDYYMHQEKAECNGEQGWVVPKYMSLNQALEQADETGLQLVYSPKAIEALETIQIMDLIMGRNKRTDEEFAVTTSMMFRENVEYISIDTIQVYDMSTSFGTESFDALNTKREGENVTKLVKDDETLALGCYDRIVTDRILQMNPEKVRSYFRNAGLPNPELDAFMGRFQKVQTALRNDRQGNRNKSRRQYNTLKSILKTAEARQDAATYLKVEAKLEEHLTTEALEMASWGYARRSFIRDQGNLNEGSMTNVNRDIDAELNSEKRMVLFKTALKEMIDEDRRGGFGAEGIPEATIEVHNALEAYANMLQRGQDAKKLMQTKPFREVFQEHEPERFHTLYTSEAANGGTQEQINARIEERLRNQFHSMHEYLLGREADSLERARRLINERIDNLKAQENLTDAQKKELNRMVSYNVWLTNNMVGSLEVPEGTRVREISDERTVYTNWNDRKTAPLFSHPPCISDVNQGAVGDCYFIATLAAVVDKDPEFILNHMKDNGDGTVTVKFYKPNERGAEPVYVKVAKTVPLGAVDETRIITNAGALGALWVQLYEKAFLVSGLITDREKKKSKYNFEDIKGGSSQNALMWITGKKVAQIDHQFNGKPGTMGRIATTIPDNWFTMRDNGVREYSDLFKQKAAEMLRFLQNGIAQGKTMVGGTWNSFPGYEGLGDFGEQTRRGLMAMHEYSSLGLEKHGGRDYVVIRNPWGRGVVDTVENERTHKTVIRGNKDRLGAFLLDIYTFTEHFSDVSAA